MPTSPYGGIFCMGFPRRATVLAFCYSNKLPETISLIRERFIVAHSFSEVSAHSCLAPLLLGWWWDRTPQLQHMRKEAVPCAMTAGKVSRGVETRVLQCPLNGLEISHEASPLKIFLMGLGAKLLTHGLWGGIPDVDTTVTQRGWWYVWRGQSPQGWGCFPCLGSGLCSGWGLARAGRILSLPSHTESAYPSHLHFPHSELYF